MDFSLGWGIQKMFVGMMMQNQSKLIPNLKVHVRCSKNVLATNTKEHYLLLPASKTAMDSKLTASNLKEGCK
jgi:hypothetical protein